MNFLIKCQNKNCGRELLVDKVPPLSDLLFENKVSIINCPICNTKTAVTISVKHLGVNANDKKA